MRPVNVVLASALMLGGMSVAYAQGGPPQKDGGGPAQAQQQQAPGGGASRGAEPQGNQGRGPEAGPRAQRGGGEGQRSAGQGNQDGGKDGGPRRQQAQDDGPQKQKDGARASKQDDGEGKRAQRKQDDAKDAKRADRDDDRSKDAKRAETKDDQAKDAKRAETKDDQAKDAKRAETKDDQAKDAKRAETKDDQAKDAKRAETKDDQTRDAKRAEGKDDRADDTKRAETKDGDAERVQLSGDREQRVRSAFRQHADVRERTNVDIDINIGRRLPRDWDYYPLPTAIIEIVPEYRGYRYVYVEDRYVIVHPTTYEVVTVIDSSGGRTYAGGSGGCPSELSLSDDERDYLLQTVQMRNVSVGDVTIGMDVPDSVELHTFPDPVIDRISVLSSCRYFVADDRIAIVDPSQHEVVVLID